MNKQLNFDFLIVPMILIRDPNIQTLDCLVYGVIYGASQLKDKKCFLSNEGIADTVGSTPKTIGNSLNRLEEANAIFRRFSDESKRKRTEIIPLIKYGKIHYKHVPSTDGTVPSTDGTVPSTDGTVPSTDGTGLHPQMEHVPSTDGQSNNIEKEHRVRILNKKDIFQKENTVFEEVTKKDSDKPDLTAHIKLFEVLYPQEFSGTKSPYFNTAIQDAVLGLMNMMSYKELEEMIVVWKVRQFEKFTPSVGGIIEFADWKFAKIKQFLGRSKYKHSDSPLMGNFAATGVMKDEKERELVESIQKSIADKKKKI